ncbi:MAG TPA: mechanosensitive ion channel family protein [Rhabdochlamydiaceae bacterium]|jgi:MscS family membrane protein|nr:mechanosensitive ion channel family protein [Rhabdochlamydiaceae bacterium]
MSSNYFWLIEAAAGFLGLYGIQCGINKLIALTGKKKGEDWRLRSAKILKPPVTTLLWALYSVYLIKIFGKHFDFGSHFSFVMEYLGAVRKTAVILCSVWLFFRWKNAIETNLIVEHAKKVDVNTVRVVGRLITLAIGLVTTLVTLQTFGVNIAPLLAFGSIGAASIGFAGKDVIANFCSGIILQITRPFVQGDQILLPEKHIEGQIEDIGWFRTSIRDIEKRALYLPNNYFSTMVVVNVTRMTHKRIKQTLKLPLTSIEKISDAIPKIREMISRTETIDNHFPTHVFLKTFGDYACEVEIEAYSTITDNEKFNQFQQQLLLKVQAILAEKEIPFALPTMNFMSWKQTF